MVGFLGGDSPPSHCGVIFGFGVYKNISKIMILLILSGLCV